jgi:hypothetical protein
VIGKSTVAITEEGCYERDGIISYVMDRIIIPRNNKQASSGHAQNTVMPSEDKQSQPSDSELEHPVG